MTDKSEGETYKRIFEALHEAVIIYDAETSLIVEANRAASDLHGYQNQEFCALPPSTFVHPESLTQFTGWTQAAQTNTVYEFTAHVRHLQRDGTPFMVEIRGTHCIYQERPCLLTIVRDVSQQLAAEQLLKQQVAARQHEQATLLDISQTLSSALDLKPALILDQLAIIIDYTHAVLFELNDLELMALSARGSQKLEQAVPFQIKLTEQDRLSAMFNDRQPQRIADVWGRDPDARFLLSLLDDYSFILLKGIHAWMWLPLAVKGNLIGGIAVAHAEPDHFTVHQANLALTVANQAAITMVNAQLYEQAQAAATLEERQRLAQSLHDAVNQSLFSANLIAEVLPRLWVRAPDQGRQSLEDLRRLIRGAMAEMRGLLVELRPLVLTDADLEDLLCQLADALTGRTDTPVLITVSGESYLLPGEVQVTLYRLCQETLNNVAKHAKAQQVSIKLHYEAQAVSLQISDDGCGFDTSSQTASGHHGLSMMHERARKIGATLTITSQLEQGTEIFIRWLTGAKETVL